MVLEAGGASLVVERDWSILEWYARAKGFSLLNGKLA